MNYDFDFIAIETICIICIVVALVYATKDKE